MRKLRQLFLTGLLALVSIPMFAEKGEMKAKLRDGTTVSVELVNGMQSTVWTLHEDGASLNLMVYTGRILNDETGKPYEDPGDPESGQISGKIHFDMELDKISDISFSGLASVNEISAGPDIRIDVKNGLISISGVESPIDVPIHSTAGMLQYEERVTSDRMIDVRALGTGVHVVKAGSSTFKILTK